MISEQRMQRRTLNEILPLSQIIYVIGNNNLKCIFFMTYCQIINFFSWFGPWKVNIYQTAYHSLTHWYTLTFLIIFNLINNLYLCPLGISVYVQTAGPSDFQNVSGISFLPANFTIDEDNFSSITEHSLVVLDDFSFKFVNKKQAKINFLKVVNYLILVIHNLFSNNLSNDILCAHHVFLTFTNLGYLIMRWYYILYFYKALHNIYIYIFFFRKLFMRLGGPEVLDSSKVSRKLIIISRMWTQHKTLSLIELKICLTRRTILFANKQTFLIHDAEKDCSQSLSQLKKS